ncbi:helix-turn-helix transcriptional regulator [Nisaea sp.]|uniref:helix-turn-helix transcriptional regulator n=1 Tax=Nisaea sp. TaxID=2024842 RepID=UPI003B52E2A5
MNERLLTPDEMVSLLCLPSRRALYTALHAYPETLPPPIRIGKRLRWLESVVKRWMRELADR